MVTLTQAKQALDSVIEKGRVHLYKPIQVAEILYHDRVHKDIDLENLEDYRTASKKWRDAVTIPLVGRKCTSRHDSKMICLMQMQHHPPYWLYWAR